jgi:hypothetical protein
VIAAEAHQRWDITFDSVEAFNEPASDWWIATGTQEGCHFDPPTQVRTPIPDCADFFSISFRA